MDELCAHLMLDLVVYCVLPFIYAGAVEAIKAGDSAAMRAMWRENTPTSKACECAALEGDLDALKWLLDKDRDAVLYSRSVMIAAQKGHFLIVKWLLRNGAYCPKKIVNRAIESGNTKLVKWLVERGYSCNVTFQNKLKLAKWYSRHDDRDELKMAKWVRENFDDFDEHRVFKNAIEQGRFGLAKWMWETKTVPINVNDVSYISLQIDLKWLHEELGYRFTLHDVRRAFEESDLETIKYVCCAVGRKLHLRNAVINAASCGRFEIVKWAYEKYDKGCFAEQQHADADENDSDETQELPLCLNAVIDSGDLDVVQWFFERDVFGTFYQPIDTAARKGHLHIVEWFHSIGYTSTILAIDYAIREGHNHVVKWLVSTGYRSANVVCSAIKDGNSEIVGWLLDRGFEAESDLMNIAASLGNVEIMQILHAHGYKFTQIAMNLAIKNSRVGAIEWLYDEFALDIPVECVNASIRHGGSVLSWLKDRGIDIAYELNNKSYADVMDDLDSVIWLVDNYDKDTVRMLVANNKPSAANVIAYLESKLS